MCVRCVCVCEVCLCICVSVRLIGVGVHRVCCCSHICAWNGEDVDSKAQLSLTLCIPLHCSLCCHLVNIALMILLYAHTCIHVQHTNTCAHSCTHTHIHMHAHIHTHTHTHTHTHSHIHAHIHTHTHTTCIHIHTHTHTYNIHSQIHAHMHTHTLTHTRTHTHNTHNTHTHNTHNTHTLTCGHITIYCTHAASQSGVPSRLRATDQEELVASACQGHLGVHQTDPPQR